MSSPWSKAAGNYFIRYPGGSSSDDYHWNGTGVGPNNGYDANDYWVPSGTSYTPGFQDYDIYTGTTSSYGIPSNLTDGDTSTVWLSNVDTAYPDHQWAELDLTGSAGSPSGDKIAIDALTIVWGTPAAATFQVQYWTGSPIIRSPTNGPNESNWVTTSSGTVAGTGAGTTQGVTFTAVSAGSIRILLTLQHRGGWRGLFHRRNLCLWACRAGHQNTDALDGNNVPTQTWGCGLQHGPGQFLRLFLRPAPDTRFRVLHELHPLLLAEGLFPSSRSTSGPAPPSEAASWVHYANKTPTNFTGSTTGRSATRPRGTGKRAGPSPPGITCAAISSITTP